MTGRRDLVRDLRHRQAFGRLAAGHRHHIVIEIAVGDVDAGSRRRAVASEPEWVLVPSPRFWNVRLAGERRLPDQVTPSAPICKEMVCVRRLAPTAPCRGGRCRPWRGLGDLGQCYADSPNKYGVRCFCTPMPSAGRSNASSFARRCSSAGRRPSLRSRATSAAPRWASSPSLGSSGAPVSRACRYRRRFQASTFRECAEAGPR